MQFKETFVKISNDVELHICCQFFQNRTLVQLRWNGELDTSYSVTCTDPTMVLQEHSPYGTGEEDQDYDDFHQDPLSNYQINTLFGDSSNLELPIIASQISELFIKSKDFCPATGSFIVMLSSKIFHNQTDAKFDILLQILSSIKQHIILA